MHIIILFFFYFSCLFSFDKTCGDVDCLNTIFISSIVDNGDGNIHLVFSYDFQDEVAGFQFNLLSEDVISFDPNSIILSSDLSNWNYTTMNADGMVLGFDVNLSTLTGAGELFTIQGIYDMSHMGSSIIIDASEDCGNGIEGASSIVCRKENGDTRMVLSNIDAETIELSHFHEATWIVGSSSDSPGHLSNEDSDVYAYQLLSNYPNPFNPSTSIVYSIGNAGPVSIVIYDMQGREVRTLVSGYALPGEHKVVWDSLSNNGVSVSAGIYVYTITSNDFSASRKMLLLK